VNRRGKNYTQMYPVKMEGAFFNFTELAARFGFRPKPVNPNFLLGQSYPGADWWHFQWDKGLEFGVSTFGGELRKMFPLKMIEGHLRHWDEVKNFRFGLEWL
jgi:hypothetical protein